MKNTLTFLLLCLLLSCSKSENETIPKSNLKHSVLVYMSANNNLYKDAVENIVSMQSNWKDYYNGNVVVFLDPLDGKGDSRLLEIGHSNKRDIDSRVVKTYPNMNCLEVANMNAVITDFVEQYPADIYTLILWSHGTGWYPSSYSYTLNTRKANSIPVKSFGQDGYNHMEIPDLARAIPDNVFTNIIFDACLMAGVETAYELKDKAKRIVASPAEVITDGFPYNKLVPQFFDDTKDAVSYAKAFFDDYDRREGAWRSATVSVVNTSELDNLAKITSKMLKEADVSKIDKSKLQSFDEGVFYRDTIFIDFKDFVNQVYQGGLTSEFEAQLKRTVIYSAYYSEGLFLNKFKINRSSGLTCYIPSSKVHLNTFYRKFKWYSESGLGELVKN